MCTYLHQLNNGVIAAHCVLVQSIASIRSEKERPIHSIELTVGEASIKTARWCVTLNAFAIPSPTRRLSIAN
ncbi:MAG: hypothetical protein ACI9G1_002694 [Pirellulaceae bacterium]|jgi:hypothetical protein